MKKIKVIFLMLLPPELFFMIKKSQEKKNELKIFMFTGSSNASKFAILRV
jgi:hypothetical protein